MRIDKYLKVTRLVKRRTVCKELAEKGRVYINGKVAKPASEINENDVVEINLADRVIKIRVTSVKEYAPKEEVYSLFEVIEEKMK